jgi:antirestriction protein ArdC
MSNERQDVYTRITDKIIADLEQGVRTWMKTCRGHPHDELRR